VKQYKNTLKPADSKLRSLTSLNQVEYDQLLSVFSPLVEHKLSYYTLKGQMRLLYLKENPNQSYHGRMFNISQSKVSEWISYLLPVLEESLDKLKVMPQTGFKYKCSSSQQDCLLVDVTEREVPRAIDLDNQKEYYSGKKKKHTVKNLAITDQKGYVEFISESFMGSIHDKAIWDQIDFDLKELNLLADLGFVGIDKGQPNVILPHKKPKGQELTKLQKQTNKAIGSIRVRVEHAFSGVKRLKIIRNKIRLKTYLIRDKVFKIAVALHNFRIQCREGIQNLS